MKLVPSFALLLAAVAVLFSAIPGIGALSDAKMSAKTTSKSAKASSSSCQAKLDTCQAATQPTSEWFNNFTELFDDEKEGHIKDTEGEGGGEGQTYGYKLVNTVNTTTAYRDG
eukprot:scaffold9330_cov157-Skeletonema_dohrnii-CCMP3373.AAC.4